MGVFGIRTKIKSKIKNERGQAMVEMALVLPILLLILCGIIDFGWMFYHQLSLDNACREGARYAVVNTKEDHSTGSIEDYIESSVNGRLNNVDATVTYSVPSDPTVGDVTVQLTSELKFLTPVLGMIMGGQEKELVSTVIMKVES